LARNTAAVYSGLGLDISPSSSMDDSLGGSTGAPEPKNLPDASPHTILQVTFCSINKFNLGEKIVDD
jgi:hypothetical protein